MEFDFKLYNELVKQDRELTKQMVKDGELSKEDAWLRDSMRQEEILDMFD